jgi:hypothetical protein
MTNAHAAATQNARATPESIIFQWERCKPPQFDPVWQHQPIPDKTPLFFLSAYSEKSHDLRSLEAVADQPPMPAHTMNTATRHHAGSAGVYNLAQHETENACRAERLGRPRQWNCGDTFERLSAERPHAIAIASGVQDGRALQRITHYNGRAVLLSAAIR